MFDVVVSAYCVFLLQKKIALLSFALLAFHWDISRFRNHTDAFVLADGHGHLTAHRVAHAVHRRSTSLSTGPRSSTTSAPRSTHPLGAKTTPPGRPPLTPTPPSSSARPLEARKCALPPAVKGSGRSGVAEWVMAHLAAYVLRIAAVLIFGIRCCLNFGRLWSIA